MAPDRDSLDPRGALIDVLDTLPVKLDRDGALVLRINQNLTLAILDVLINFL